ncbi:MAG: acyl carrier protein [Dehalococcoidales bacterium]|nr:acyl carrier protein [Dehalococcoidales bacterium]
MANIEERVKGFFARFLDLSPAEITPQVNLRDDLKMDSTEMVELVVALEKEFNIHLKDGEITNRNCVGDLFKTVGEKLG